MRVTRAFLADALRLDAERASAEIASTIRRQVVQRLGRRGAVVGLSGGIDSSVAASLAVRALGRERVLGLFLPEKESRADARPLAGLMAEALGITTLEQDITPLLEAAGCYARRDEIARELVPAYGPGCALELVGGSRLLGGAIGARVLRVRDAGGAETRVRPSDEHLRRLLSAEHLKQQARGMLAYHHAESRAYAVISSLNRLECDQGFFAKHGDGAADLRPLAHLYKAQVYQLARHLGVPEEVRRRGCDETGAPPDERPALPAMQLDLCLFARDQGVSAEDLGAFLGLDAHQVETIYLDIDMRRVLTRHLHEVPLMVVAPRAAAREPSAAAAAWASAPTPQRWVC